jgi:superoxide oxidase
MSTDACPMVRRRVAPALVLVHWLMALMVATALGAIAARGLLPSGHAWRPMLRSLHLVSGQLIFFALLLRLALRWRFAFLPVPGTPHATLVASRTGHVLLYLALAAQPVIGLLFMQAGDKTVALLGWTWPALIASNVEWHFLLKGTHQWLGQALYALLALHVVAALWHHVLRRDDTLASMCRLRHPVADPAATAQPAMASPPDAKALAARSIRTARARAAAAEPTPAADPHPHPHPHQHQGVE